MENRKKELKYSPQFQTIFKVKLHSFLSYVTGFDIIKFDEEIIKSGDSCMEDAIHSTYGENGVSLVRELIS